MNVQGSADCDNDKKPGIMKGCYVAWLFSAWRGGQCIVTCLCYVNGAISYRVAVSCVRTNDASRSVTALDEVKRKASFVAHPWPRT